MNKTKNNTKKGAYNMARTNEQRTRAVIEITEYCVETVKGELVNYFSWRELMKFLGKEVGASKIHAQVHRWDTGLLLGKYIVTEVTYMDEVVLTPKGIQRLP
jgi:hypothetical protein